MVLHKADQRYTCEVCNKAFDRKAYLIENLEIHIGKESYSHCYKSVYHLSQHLKVSRKAVQRQTTYACDVSLKTNRSEKVLERAGKCAHEKKNKIRVTSVGTKIIFVDIYFITQPEDHWSCKRSPDVLT